MNEAKENIVVQENDFREKRTISGQTFVTQALAMEIMQNIQLCNQSQIYSVPPEIESQSRGLVTVACRCRRWKGLHFRKVKYPSHVRYFVQKQDFSCQHQIFLPVCNNSKEKSELSFGIKTKKGRGAGEIVLLKLFRAVCLFVWIVEYFLVQRYSKQNF